MSATPPIEVDEQRSSDLREVMKRYTEICLEFERKKIEILPPKIYEAMRRDKVQQMQDFCDRVAKEAAARGMTDEILAEILNEE